ncbi:uncharacterized protein KZ484_024514 [Pholidichthys leucotaenia]
MAEHRLHLGECFSSFVDLETAVKEYEKHKFTNFYKRSSRTIEAYKKRLQSDKTVSDQLKFAELDYACIHGGKNFKSRGTGKRPNHSTFQQKCPALIKVRLSKDGSQLVVKELIEEHNHLISEASKEHLPRQRYVNGAVREEVNKMLQEKSEELIQSVNKYGRHIPKRKYLQIQKTYPQTDMEEHVTQIPEVTIQTEKITQCCLHVGESFSSFDELETAIKKYEQQKLTNFYKRSSRTIEAYKKRLQCDKTFSDQLKFAEVDYACIYGGKNFKSRASGKRPNHSTFQQKCPALIKVRLSKDGSQLVVKELIEEHNHLISEATYKYLPRQRCVDGTLKGEVNKMLQVKTSKKLIRTVYRYGRRIPKLKFLQILKIYPPMDMVDHVTHIPEVTNQTEKMAEHGLHVGESFSSFDELETAIKEYEHHKLTKFYKRSSRTIEAYKKRLRSDKTFSDQLRFAEVDYACIHGGKNFKSRGTGKRPNHSTFQQKCPALIKVGLSKDGSQLVVKELIEDHNHLISEAAYKHVPRQRCVSGTIREKVNKMLHMKANKKLIRSVNRYGRRIPKRKCLQMTNLYPQIDTADHVTHTPEVTIQTEKMDDGGLHIGESFSSFDELETAIKEYEQHKLTNFYKRSSRTIEAYKKRLRSNKTFSDQLKFAEVDYACIHGGKNFRSRASGKRPNHSTFQQKCPALIKVGLSKDGSQLVVKELIEEHNHLISEETYRCPPRQRCVDSTVREKVNKMVQVKANKILIRSVNRYRRRITKRKCLQLRRTYPQTDTADHMTHIPEVTIQTEKMAERDLHVGESFSSFDELETAVKEYEQHKLTNFYKRSSRTIEAYKKRLRSNKTFSDQLKFAEVDYACIHGGKNFRSRASGKRPNHSTFQQKCPALIKVGLSKDGSKLIVKELVEEHNHLISEETYRCPPRQRCVDGTAREKVNKMLQVKAKKKFIRSVNRYGRRIPKRKCLQIRKTYPQTDMGDHITHIPEVTIQTEKMAEHDLHVGESFSSFDELETAIKEYEQHKLTNFYKRSSRTIEAYKKRLRSDKTFSDQLKFAEVNYACIYGGKNFKSHVSGKRPNHSTFQQKCPALIKVGLSTDGSQLVIKKLIEDHNHLISETTYKHLPKQRCVDGTVRREVNKILQVKASKKLIQEDIMYSTGQVVTKKDLHNAAAAHKPSHLENDLRTLLEEMKKESNSITEIVVNDENELRGIYYQDAKMRQTHAAYPEIMLIDATYKLNDLRMPLYVLMVIDGNGESHVISLWLVTCEDKQTVSALTDIFIKHNDTQGIKCIMADKDMVERDVMSEKIPHAKLQICLFHTLRMFRREITTEKMGIKAKQRLTVLEIMQKLVYAKNEEEYQQIYGKLCQLNIKPVMDYFHSQWHNIREQWVEGLKSQCVNFLISTNNRVEYLILKLKSVMTRCSGIVSFFINLKAVLSVYETEQNHSALGIVQKSAITSHTSDSPQDKYSRLLTPFALCFLDGQLSATTENIPAETTCRSCVCGFWKTMSLPCKHIFSKRQLEGVDLYDEELVAKRWVKSYFMDRHPVFSRAETADPVEPTLAVSQVSGCPQPLPQIEKYKQAHRICQRLAGLVSEATGEQFEILLQCLEGLEKLWADGCYMAVSGVDNNDTLIDDNMQDFLVLPDLNISNFVTPVLMAPPTAVVLSPPPAFDDSLPIQEAPTMPILLDSPPPPHSTQPSSPTAHPSSLITDLAQRLSPVSASGQSAVPPISPIADPAPEPSNDPVSGLSIPSTSSDPDASMQPNLDMVKMPPRMPKRGCPKGVEMTMIGLPKKRARMTGRPVPFCKQSPNEKDQAILTWLVADEGDVQRALSDDCLLPRTSLRSAKTASMILTDDERVDLKRVQKYFTTSGWQGVTSLVEHLRSKGQWLCKSCDKPLNDELSVGCDVCLEWYDGKCVGLRQALKSKTWICHNCLT